MKGIINAYSTNEYSKYNGLTVDVIGQEGRYFFIQYQGEHFPISNFEIFIVDIQGEFNAAVFRSEKIGFDYWYNSITEYMKRNKIVLERKVSPKEIIMPEPDITSDDCDTYSYECSPFNFIVNESNNDASIIKNNANGTTEKQ